MNYIYEEINNLNKDIITLEEANVIYHKRGYAVSCGNGIIVEFIKED